MRNFMKERTHQLTKETVARTNEVFPKVATILIHENMHVQCGIISELMAVWLGGMPPKARATMFKILVEGAISLIEVHDGYEHGS